MNENNNELNNQNTKKETIVLKPKAGLSNRLRFLFSFIYKMKKENIQKNLIVIWENNANCNGYLDNIICPLDNCTILHNNNKNFIINDSSCGPVTKYKSCNYLENLGFKPLPILLEKIINIIKKLDNKYIAVHIRRTDLTNHLKHMKRMHRYTDDKLFIDFLNNNKDYNIYLATDNNDTQEYYLKLYKNRIKYINIIQKIKKHRQTSLEDALIDMFVCALANKFQGTDYSSFTDFINLIRRDNNILNNYHDNPLNLSEKYK